MVACPYGARVVNESSGVVDKCCFCMQSDDGSTPAPECVSTCLTSARIFGDLDDSTSDISKAIVKSNAQPLAGNLTQAKIFYVR
jgi:Fe-S-cluster-containing dehydrogenase component